MDHDMFDEDYPGTSMSISTFQSSASLEDSNGHEWKIMQMSASENIHEENPKDYEINELLDKTMNMYDSNFLLVSSVRETFREKIEFQNRCVYKNKKKVETVRDNIKKDKIESYILSDDSDESMDESLDEEMSMFDMHIDKSSCKLDNLNKTLSEMKQQWETTKIKSENIKSALDDENARLSRNLKKWNVEWKKEDEKLEEVTRELEKKLTSISPHKPQNTRLAAERRYLSSLQHV